MLRLRRLLTLAIATLAFAGSASAQDAATIAATYAPRVVLHPDEHYALSNVDYFLSNFRLVLSRRLLPDVKLDVTPRTLADVRYSDRFGAYSTTDPRFKDNWSFESRNGCQWSSSKAACDVLYLRAPNPVAAYATRVTPEIYWRAVDRTYQGRAYAVIQYFFFLMLNDAQNKHDGEWESSVVVVDKAAFAAAGSDPIKQRAALAQILMAGHYRHAPTAKDALLANASTIFFENTAHYRHVMSLGGHGGYLFVPENGRHESSMKCYEQVRASDKKYATWGAPARLVQVDDSTPWIRYVGRWGRRYSTLGVLPMTFRFSFKPVGHCDGMLGLGWLKERTQVVLSAPYGPRFIHHQVWDWASFPAAPGETDKGWR